MGEIDWKNDWRRYLDAYITTAGVGDDPSIREEVHVHLDNEFAVGDLWSRIIPRSVDGLRALVGTGVRVGVISNADGTVAQRLAAQEVLQVGPGSRCRGRVRDRLGRGGGQQAGPAHLRDRARRDRRRRGRCLVRRRHARASTWSARRGAGLWPIVMDPFDFQPDADYARVTSLFEVAELVTSS